jgi:DNA-3-methyladenine glycosylase II
VPTTAAMTVFKSTFLLNPVRPFRLDLTAWCLRRRPGNLIDRWNEGVYRRVLVVKDHPFEIAVAQTDRTTLSVSATPRLPDHQARQAVMEQVATALGVQQRLGRFYRFSAGERELAPMVKRFRGLKPPRFFSVFEALINGIACQQLSLLLGIELLNRLARSFGLWIGEGISATCSFPRPQDLANLRPKQIRALGFNFRKARAIVDISQAITKERLNIESLAQASDEEALRRLTELDGVGRWTAEYTLLRGMGRWHIFPVDDQGARNGLARWLGLRKTPDAAHARRILRRWEPYGGLIYFHMLMNGLDQAGYLGR